jgi:hypothetical protein
MQASLGKPHPVPAGLRDAGHVFGAARHGRQRSAFSCTDLFVGSRLGALVQAMLVLFVPAERVQQG